MIVYTDSKKRLFAIGETVSISTGVESERTSRSETISVSSRQSSIVGIWNAASVGRSTEETCVSSTETGTTSTREENRLRVSVNLANGQDQDHEKGNHLQRKHGILVTTVDLLYHIQLLYSFENVIDLQISLLVLSVERSSCLLAIWFADVFDRPVVIGLYIVSSDPEGEFQGKTGWNNFHYVKTHG